MYWENDILSMDCRKHSWLQQSGEGKHAFHIRCYGSPKTVSGVFPNQTHVIQENIPAIAFVSSVRGIQTVAAYSQNNTSDTNEDVWHMNCFMPTHAFANTH